MRAQAVASALGGRLLGDDVLCEGIASLYDATSTDISFVLWPKDIRAAKKTHAAAVVVDLNTAADYADEIPCPLIVVDDIGAGVVLFNELIEIGAYRSPKQHFRNPHIDRSACVHETAIVHDAEIGPAVVLGPNVVIHDGVVIGEGCRIDAGAVIHPNVVIENSVTIGANSVVGAHGFVPYGTENVAALPCFGSVRIGANVRIGALCTIDRGFLGETRIGKNTLIDNMVHIGHDAVVGDHVIIAAQSGLAGFVRIEDRVTLGGQVGIKPHVVVEEGARINGKSLVHCDIKKHEIWSGNPSVPHAIYLRSYGKLKRTFKELHR